MSDYYTAAARSGSGPTKVVCARCADLEASEGAHVQGHSLEASEQPGQPGPCERCARMAVTTPSDMPVEYMCPHCGAPAWIGYVCCIRAACAERDDAIKCIGGLLANVKGLEADVERLREEPYWQTVAQERAATIEALEAEIERMRAAEERRLYNEPI